ncbi:MAG TPA: ABC transporter substrate-binding protein [Anaerolineae bacterium]|nr:ABC transporter substrate-binding protein [Anaerolineae bacterium]
MKRITGVVLMVVVLVSACAAPGPTGVATVAPTTAPTLTTKIRLAVTNVKFVRYLPVVMAVDMLKQKGYDIEMVTAARFDLLPTMLTQGDAELALVSPQGAWAAVAKGAPLVSLAAVFAPSWAIVTSDKVKECADLAKYPVAFSSTTGVQQAMLFTYAKEHCPGTTPQILVLGDAAGRLAALEAGQIDAASVEVDDALKLNADKPNAFHTLIRASRDFPNVQIALLASTRDWAQKNPQAVKDVIRAHLVAARQLSDHPDMLAAEMMKQLGYDAPTAKAATEAYLAEKIWDLNGGLTPEDIQLTLNLLQGINAVPPEVKASDVADLSYLNAVLDELGRR